MFTAVLPVTTTYREETVWKREEAFANMQLSCSKASYIFVNV